jgi:3-methyladenine DNA glycosylase AlkD
MAEDLSTIIQKIRERMNTIGDEKIAEHSKKYLKSPYEFYGIRVPELRKIAKDYKNFDMYNIYKLVDILWSSGNHEEMSLALFILEDYSDKFDSNTWTFIINRLEKAKTWDHIDWLSSAILGEILAKDIRFMTEIKEMALSKNPWIRRTAIVSTLPLIRKNKIELTLTLAEKLVYDSNVYVQKAAGWMLREAGKKDRLYVRDFIITHKDMKKIALSYATEKMPEVKEIVKEKLKAEEESEEEN